MKNLFDARGLCVRARLDYAPIAMNCVLRDNLARSTGGSQLQCALQKVYAHPRDALSTNMCGETVSGIYEYLFNETNGKNCQNFVIFCQ